MEFFRHYDIPEKKTIHVAIILQLYDSVVRESTVGIIKILFQYAAGQDNDVYSHPSLIIIVWVSKTS